MTNVTKTSNCKGEKKNGEILMCVQKFKVFTGCPRTYYYNKFVKERVGHSIF